MDSWTIATLALLCLEALGLHLWINRSIPAQAKTRLAQTRVLQAHGGRPPAPDSIPHRPYRTTPTQKYKHAPLTARLSG